jgi:hypothetical protein
MYFAIEGRLPQQIQVTISSQSAGIATTREGLWPGEIGESVTHLAPRIQFSQNLQEDRETVLNERALGRLGVNLVSEHVSCV